MLLLLSFEVPQQLRHTDRQIHWTVKSKTTVNSEKSKKTATAAAAAVSAHSFSSTVFPNMLLSHLF